MKDRIIYFSSLTQWINENRKAHAKLIVCGDFNSTILEINQYKIRQKSIDSHINKLMNNLILANVDSLKINAKCNRPTYIHSNANRKSSTIDYILANDILVKNITRFNVKTTPSPDHRALIINIESHNHQRGKSYWKLNVSVLDHDEYKCKIIAIFDEVLNSSKYLA